MAVDTACIRMLFFVGRNLVELAAFRTMHLTQPWNTQIKHDCLLGRCTSTKVQVHLVPLQPVVGREMHIPIHQQRLRTCRHTADANRRCMDGRSKQINANTTVMFASVW